MRFQEPVNILPGTSPWKKSELADSKTENQCTLARGAFRGKDVMADFVCHCTSHLNILRGDEEMDECCFGVSTLFFCSFIVAQTLSAIITYSICRF